VESIFGDELLVKNELDREILTKIFIKNLYGLDSKTLVSMLYSKYEAMLTT
jgi:hypothetical protein